MDSKYQAKIKTRIQQNWSKIAFISGDGENLQRILCKNKPKLLPNSNPGVYQLDWTCNAKYIGE